MFAQDEKIIRKTFTKRSKKNLLWNEQVTIPCDIFDALPVNFNLSFFPLAEKNMLLLTSTACIQLLLRTLAKTNLQNFFKR